MAEVIKEVQTFQQECYNFVEQEKITNYLKSQDSSPLEENELYELSLQSEPRESSKDDSTGNRAQSTTLSKGTAPKLTKTLSVGTDSVGKASGKKKGQIIDPEILASLSEQDRNRLVKLQKIFGDDFDFANFQKSLTPTSSTISVPNEGVKKKYLYM